MWRKPAHWLAGLALGLVLATAIQPIAKHEPSVAHAEEVTPSPTPTPIPPDSNPGGSGGE